MAAWLSWLSACALQKYSLNLVSFFWFVLGAYTFPYTQHACTYIRIHALEIKDTQNAS